MMTILRYFIKGREREKTCTAMMTTTATTATAEKETSRIELRKSVDLRGGGSTDRSHSAAFQAQTHYYSWSIIIIIVKL